MKKIFYGLFLLAPVVANAEVLDLDVALRATYTACVGIDDELADLKKMAGINTAVTGVGTALGVGATAVGIAKASKDAQAEAAAKTAKDAVEKAMEYTKDNVGRFKAPTQEQMDAFLAEFKRLGDEEWDKNVKPLRDESKKLGNWRTGLMAGNTATNIAGAIIAGNNKMDKDLETQIDDCRKAVVNLRDSVVRARIEGQDVAEATEIVSACGEYEYVYVSKINSRAKGALISSIVGATTGVAGTATSAVANSDEIRNENRSGKNAEGEKKLDRTDAEWQKEKNWNTAANVLAGTSTVASGVATVFNATQISAIKKVANVAEKCTGVLK